MKLANSYNKIANAYDENSDAFNLLTSSRFSALQEILMRLDGDQGPNRILDLGIGSGAFLAQLKEKFPDTQFAGVDIAKKMLAIASKRIPGLEAIESSIADISPANIKGQFDLMIAHFVLAYVDINTLLEKAQLFLSEGGMISIVTTTHESFPNFQEQIRHQLLKNSLQSRIIRKIYKTGIKKTSVPRSYEAIKVAALENNLEIINRQQISTDILFQNATEMTDFAVKGGWLLNALDYPFLPTTASYNLVRNYFNRTIRFPWEDKHIVESVLLQKA